MNKIEVNKSTKNTLIVLLILSLVLLLSFTIVTFSKYATEKKVDSTQSIAKWVFSPTVKKDNVAVETLSLADKLAPGKNGTFTIEIDTTGNETDLEYEILAENESNKPTNLYYRLSPKDNAEDVAKFSTLTELLSSIGKKTLAVADNGVVTIPVYWYWDIDSGNDAADTADGINANTYTFDIMVKGVQTVK